MSENTNTNTNVDSLLTGQEAAHGADGSSLTDMGHVREELWFRNHDAELIAKLKAKQPANTTATPRAVPSGK